MIAFFYVCVHPGHYRVAQPSTFVFAGTVCLTPDPLNSGGREHGLRVRIWRMIESVDRQGPRARALQLVVDQYEQLSKDTKAGGRLLPWCLHPFIIKQALRHKYVDLALEFIAVQLDVWLTTSGDIAAHFRTVAPARLR